MSQSAAARQDETLETLSAARSRIVTAALDLFAQHGVGATSLGMIAAELGVTKAAIYHQYRTKQEIVLAVAESELARLVDVINRAEAQKDATKARNALLAGMVDLVIERGRRVSTLLIDPVIGHMFSDHDSFLEAMERLSRLLHGKEPGHDERIQTAILIAAISGALMHPFSDDVDDATLRAQLLRLARRYLGLRGDV